MLEKLDAKFYGVIVKNKDESIVPQDQYMVFLAKDAAVVAMLEGVSCRVPAVERRSGNSWSVWSR